MLFENWRNNRCQMDLSQEPIYTQNFFCKLKLTSFRLHLYIGYWNYIIQLTGRWFISLPSKNRPQDKKSRPYQKSVFHVVLLEDQRSFIFMIISRTSFFQELKNNKLTYLETTGSSD